MKIAILILLHEYNQQQKKLISHLSKDFDVYVHIDKKSDIKVSDVCNERVFSYKKYKVYWGSFNQILATIFLFKIASENSYDRYIFISGSDVPLKTNLEIYNFFENNNVEYFLANKLPCEFWDGNGGFDRVDYFYYQNKNINYNMEFIGGGYNLIRCFMKFSNLLLKKLRGLENRILKKFFELENTVLRKLKKVRRLNMNYFGGANWMDLTDSCVKQIIAYVEKNKKFVNSFKNTRCADEIFFQTIICNYVHGIQRENKVMRYIDWETGPEYPRILRVEDYGNIKKSDAIFARKFNSNTDSTIIEKLYSDIECM